MNCLVLLLPCLAHTGKNKVGPDGMQHLSEALKTNKSLTSLSIECTLGGQQRLRLREGSDKKKQGLCVCGRCKVVWALVRICGSAQSGRYQFVRVSAPAQCVGWSGVSVSGVGVVHRRRLCMAGYIYTALSGWWRDGCVKCWVAEY